MGSFRYKAVNPEGRSFEGQLEAADIPAAAFHLQGMGLIPVSIEEPAERRDVLPSVLRRVTRKDVLLFTEELHTLVRSGLPLDRSLRIAKELTSKPAMAAVVEDLLGQVKDGKSVADAFGSHPKHFSPLFVSMVRAGEAGGVLDVMLGRLVEFNRAAYELRAHLSTALVYPALLMSVGAGSIGILFYFVIPRFASIFQDIGAPVPIAAEILLEISLFMRAYWWALALGALVAVLSMRLWLQDPSGRRRWDAFKLHLPLVGPTLMKIEMARIARTLGTLLGGAVPLMSGIRIVQSIARNQLVVEAVSRLGEGVKSGEGLAKPMKATGVFPDLAVHLVAVGEETGRLDEMLIQLADVYEGDVRTSIRTLTSVFEPAVILVMGVVIGIVVLTMLTAIFSINEIAI